MACSTDIDVWNLGPVNDMVIVNTFVASKPGATDRSAMDVRIKSPEPITSANASAISATTSVDRT